jgi:hypothetical protein
MQYMVIGGDGHQYGPVSLGELRQWVTEGRVNWDSKVRNLSNGMQMKASNMPELDGYFAPTAKQHAAAVSGYLYNRPGSKPADYKNPMGEFWTVFGLSAAGGISSCLLGPFSFCFSGYALYRGWLAIKDNEVLAGLAFAIAIVASLTSLAMTIVWIVVLSR